MTATAEGNTIDAGPISHPVAAESPVLQDSGDCWNRIGINGDNSCPELKQVIHCRNCPVFAEAGRGLLDREVPADYREEWGALLARPKDSVKSATQSVVVFSLGLEYLALPTAVFREVAEMRVVHRLPGGRQKLLMGLVNIRGEIQICVSLGALLKLAAEPETRSPQLQDGRMLVVEHSGETWVFPVDKVHGTFRYELESLRPLPSTLEKTAHSLSRGTIVWEGKTVGCLNGDAIFSALRGNIA